MTPVDPWDRLDDDGGHSGRVMQRQHALFEFIGEFRAVFGQAAGEGVPGDVERMAQMVDAGQRRSEMLAVAGDAADRDTAETDAVISALAADQARTQAVAAHAVIG
jgi:hypothetical protein